MQDLFIHMKNQSVRMEDPFIHIEDPEPELVAMAEWVFNDNTLKNSDKFIYKYINIFPIITMINKKDYDFLNKYRDGICRDERVKYKLFLITCAITDDIKMIDYFVDCLNIDVHKKDDSEWNGLMIACWKNKNLNIIKHLLEYYKINQN